MILYTFFRAINCDHCKINMLKNMLKLHLKSTLWTKERGLFQWIDNTFNRLDEDRIQEIGPNMACAEWLMKNGAYVRWKGCKEFVNHYDCLPNITCKTLKQFKIEQVYAGKDASISHLGFSYFKNCNNISDMSFVECNTIDNEALSKLQFIKDSLTCLHINGCHNVSDKGILTLEYLQALKRLELKNLKFKNESEIINHIKVKLPECNVVFNVNES